MWPALKATLQLPYDGFSVIKLTISTTRLETQFESLSTNSFTVTTLTAEYKLCDVFEWTTVAGKTCSEGV